MKIKLYNIVMIKKGFLTVTILILIGFNQICQAKTNHFLGTKLGIQTSKHIKNIYNKSKKDIKGIFLGIQTSNLIYKIHYKYPHNIANIKGIKLGIQTSNKFIQNEEKINTYIGKDITLLKEIHFAITLNILEYLNNFTNRTKALENNITYLKNLEVIQKDKIDRIQQKIKELEKIIETQNKKTIELENSFFTSIDKLRAKNAENTLQEIIPIIQNKDKSKAYLGALNKINEYHLKFHPILVKRIKALELNREALIKGIRVTEIEDINLGLILN